MACSELISTLGWCSSSRAEQCHPCSLGAGMDGGSPEPAVPTPARHLQRWQHGPHYL